MTMICSLTPSLFNILKSQHCYCAFRMLVCTQLQQNLEYAIFLFAMILNTVCVGFLLPCVSRLKYLHYDVCILTTHKLRCATSLLNAPRLDPRALYVSSLCSWHPTWSMTTWGCTQCLQHVRMVGMVLLARHNHLRRVRCGSRCARCWAHLLVVGAGWACSITCRHPI